MRIKEELNNKYLFMFIAFLILLIIAMFIPHFRNYEKLIDYNMTSRECRSMCIETVGEVWAGISRCEGQCKFNRLPKKLKEVFEQREKDIINENYNNCLDICIVNHKDDEIISELEMSICEQACYIEYKFKPNIK